MTQNNFNRYALVYALILDSKVVQFIVHLGGAVFSELILEIGSYGDKIGVTQSYGTFINYQTT